MKSSLLVVAGGAVLASAGPLGKRVIETHVVVQTAVVTVTAGAHYAPPASTPAVVVEVAPEPEAEAPPPAPPAEEPKVVEQAPALDNYQDYVKSMLEHHNVHRRNHSAGDLAWDDTLAKYAEATANSCVFQHDMNQGQGGYGQNLASWGGSGDIDGVRVKTGAAGVTNQWYNGELASFNVQSYGLPNPQSSDFAAWGHFTQLVWKSTTKVGCATVKCGAGTVLGLQSWYTVCNYNPAGNFAGKYGENVGSPLGHGTVTV